MQGNLFIGCSVALSALVWGLGPLATEENFLGRAVGSNVTATTLDEAQGLRLSVVAGDFLAAMLESEGFAALDVAPELALDSRMLVAGRIALVVVTQSDLQALLAAVAAVAPAVTPPATAFSAACHRSMPDATFAQISTRSSRRARRR